MLAFPRMLVDAAKQAGIEVPEDPVDFDPEQYLRFAIFCKTQLGREMLSPTDHWGNAVVIADIPEEDLKTITMSDLAAMGFR